MITGKKTALALTVALLSACGGGGGATVLNISAVEAYRVADKTVELLHQRMLQQFNPTGRLNPGISLTTSSTL